MGTHPIFESDFDCLTVIKNGKVRSRGQDRRQSGQIREDERRVRRREDKIEIEKIKKIKESRKSQTLLPGRRTSGLTSSSSTRRRSSSSSEKEEKEKRQKTR